MCEKQGMTILPFIAASLLALSAALFFGPQLVMHGPRGLLDLARHPQARLVAAGLASAFILLLFAPLAGSALISGGETVQVVAINLPGLRAV